MLPFPTPHLISCCSLQLQEVETHKRKWRHKKPSVDLFLKAWQFCREHNILLQYLQCGCGSQAGIRQQLLCSPDTISWLLNLSPFVTPGHTHRFSHASRASCGSAGTAAPVGHSSNLLWQFFFYVGHCRAKEIFGVFVFCKRLLSLALW